MFLPYDEKYIFLYIHLNVNIFQYTKIKMRNICRLNDCVLMSATRGHVYCLCCRKLGQSGHTHILPLTEDRFVVFFSFVRGSVQND